MRRKWILLFTVAMLILTGGPSGASAALAECLDLSGSISLDKQSAVIGETVTFTYTLTPGGQLAATVQRPPADIVLVLDISGSMKEEMKKGSRQTRLEALKAAAQTLVNRFRAMEAGDRIGIVTFNELGEEMLGLTSDFNRVQLIINGLRAEGSTNMGDGLDIARSMLDKSSAGRKAVIALTDGMNTHYTGYINLFGLSIKSPVQDYDKARKYAAEKAQALARDGVPVYAIALGQPGMNSIDHALLDEIAQKTGGRKYDAEDANKLADVFADITQVITMEGELNGIRILQPLPEDGFELAEGNPPGTELVDGTLVIPVPSIKYPYDASSIRKLEVKLIPTGIVKEYEFEDAVLTYRDGCGNTQETVIPNGYTLAVTGWVDVWGNLYAGRNNGEVTRYRLGDPDKPQWTAREKTSRVTDISFLDSAPGVDDDAIVVVTYEDGSSSTWDLRPTAPVAVLLDADGAEVEPSGWHKGKASLILSGSGNRLPAGTVYHNGDFLGTEAGGAYVAKYRYRIGGAWHDAEEGMPIVLDALGPGIRIEAEALTAAISGDPGEPVAGETAEVIVNLDGSLPEGQLELIPATGDPLNPTVRLIASDAESGIKRISVAAESQGGIVRTLSLSFAAPSPSATASWPLSDFFEDPGDRTGWIKFTAQIEDGVGRTNGRFRTAGDPADKDKHFELVYGGPKGVLATDADYSAKASAIPVTVRVAEVADLLVKARTGDCADCEAVTTTRLDVKIVTKKPDGSVSATPWTKLGAMSFRVTGEGRNDLYLRVTDSLGNVHDTEALGQPLTILIRYDQQRH